jgi:hypothetical protein
VQTPGTLLEYDDWHATLIRPDYAQVFNEALDGIPGEGQFALILLAVSNSSNTPRPIPADLFTIVDEQGRTYMPLAGASSDYLATYGRGERGDLALEDEFPPGGIFSVPLIFRVEPDASDLILTMGNQTMTGWQILGATPSS